MILFLIINLLACAYCCDSAPITPHNTPRCLSDDSFEIAGPRESFEEQCRDILVGSTLSHYQAIEILRNSILLLDEDSTLEQRTTRFLQPARNLVRMMTGESIMFPPEPQASFKLGRSTLGPDPEFTPPKGERAAKHRFTDNSAKLILAMVDSNKTTKSIKAMYPKYSPSRISELREQVAGSSPMVQFEKIDAHVDQRVQESRRNLHIVRGYMIQTWASEYARAIGAVNFKASLSWLNRFKKRHGIGSRKIGKTTSRAKEDNKDTIQSNKFAFLDDFDRQRLRFHNGLIFNFDQSGFEYEMSSGRTLSWIGERDTIAIVDQANMATHSYTIQPVVSRDGKMLGKLLICLQEPTGENFGARIGPQVRQMERSFGNIHVVASKSGKMSAALMKQWVQQTLVPPIQEEASANPPPAAYEPVDQPQPGCSWAQTAPDQPPQLSCPQPTALVLADSWGGNINREVQNLMVEAGIKFLQIPAGTTDDLQPCDIEIFRQ